jgi:hypothetical protein
MQSTTPRQEEPALPLFKWKKAFVKAAGFGVGVTLALAMVAGVLLWYTSRPTPWTSGVITAKYSVLEASRVGDDVHVMFRYALTNNSRNDYSVPSPPSAELMRKASDGTGYVPLHASWESQTIPPGRAINVDFTVSYALADYNTTATEIDKTDKALVDFLERRLAEYDGLLLIDHVRRYQIDLPKWPPPTGEKK